MTGKLAKEAIGSDEMHELIASAAKATGYERCFGVTGCDLSEVGLWAVYTRQSTEEQTHNNRFPDYLRTCAHEAKKLGVVVPIEYVLYDAVTGEHLERPGMIRLRRLVAERKIAGVIFPALDRLSREPIHQQIFDMEAAHHGVRVHYADAPNGTDLGSQFTRTILAYAAKLTKESNHKNARGGQIGRVMKGWVPAHKAPYGYRYMADREIGSDSRVHIKRAWWEIDAEGPEGTVLEGTPAGVVAQVFSWIGSENRTMFWVADTLNGMGATAPLGGKWTPARVSNILRNHCYTGKHAYNVNELVANPDKPILDITAEIKRTVVKQKPESDWVTYEVPKIVDQELWSRANRQVKARGRGRGKRGKSIQALLRNRIFCPRCGAPMVVRRNGKLNRVYYHCSKYFKKWADNPCTYNKFIPATWDEVVWMDLCALLSDDTWVKRELEGRKSTKTDADKLIRLERFKITQAKAKIAKIQEGFEGDLYGLEEAKSRTASYHLAIARAEDEVNRLCSLDDKPLTEERNLEALKEELRAIRDRNLNDATFEQKVEVVTKLGIEVYPAEDLKSMKVKCRLGHGGPNGTSGQPRNSSAPVEAQDLPEECGIVSNAPPSSALIQPGERPDGASGRYGVRVPQLHHRLP